MPRPLQENLSGTDLDRDSDPKGEIHGRISSIRDKEIVTTARCTQQGSGRELRICLFSHNHTNRAGMQAKVLTNLSLAV